MVNFPKLPYVVAKNIVLNGMHPVAAWRLYYKISKEDLSISLNLPVSEIEKIESTNTHLKQEYLTKLTTVFNVQLEALNIRYHHII